MSEMSWKIQRCALTPKRQFFYPTRKDIQLAQLGVRAAATTSQSVVPYSGNHVAYSAPNIHIKSCLIVFT